MILTSETWHSFCAKNRPPRIWIYCFAAENMLPRAIWILNFPRKVTFWLKFFAVKCCSIKRSRANFDGKINLLNILIFLGISHSICLSFCSCQVLALSFFVNSWCEQTHKTHKRDRNCGFSWKFKIRIALKLPAKKTKGEIRFKLNCSHFCLC